MPPIGITRVRHAAAALFGVVALAAAGPAVAAQTVSVELNRLEPVEDGCRVSLVVANPGDKAFDSLKLDLVFFDRQGVISRRLVVEAGPLRASKTTVKLFDASKTPCEDIGRLLLNDVTACGGEQDCLALVATSSRVKDVEFGK